MEEWLNRLLDYETENLGRAAIIKVDLYTIHHKLELRKYYKYKPNGRHHA